MLPVLSEGCGVFLASDSAPVGVSKEKILIDTWLSGLRKRPEGRVCRRCARIRCQRSHGKR
jgi:hypothetical protein